MSTIVRDLTCVHSACDVEGGVVIGVDRDPESAIVLYIHFDLVKYNTRDSYL